MRKIIFSAMLLGLSFYANSFERRLSGEFCEFESSDKNTSAAELPMSPYKNGSIVFFRNDTAYMFQPTVDYKIDSIVICPELMGLHIDGTFAYDQAAGKLYFSKLGSADKNDLYEATWESDAWKNVKQLEIRGVMTQQLQYKNSSLAVSRWVQQGRGASGFYNPSLGMNGSRIYFSGDFKSGKGARDLWFIDKQEDGIWSRPQSVSDTINTPSTEDYAYIIGDTLMFFSSNRQGGLGGSDIYVAHKKKNQNDWNPATILTDVVNSSADDYNVAFGAEYGAYFISNRQGGKGNSDIYSAALFRPVQDVELTMESMLDEPKGFHWVLFFFDYDKSTMKPEYQVQLNELFEAMKEFPDTKFEISGHTDSRGADSYNMDLSAKRAKYVRDLLIEKGADPNSMVSVGRGFHDPVIPNAQTEPEHEQNRRVDVKIIETVNE